MPNQCNPTVKMDGRHGADTRSTRLVNAVIWGPAEVALLPAQDAKRATFSRLIPGTPSGSITHQALLAPEDLECTLEEPDTHSRWVNLGQEEGILPRMT